MLNESILYSMCPSGHFCLNTGREFMERRKFLKGAALAGAGVATTVAAPAIAALRTKGYIQGMLKLPKASLAIWDSHSGTYIC